MENSASFVWHRELPDLATLPEGVTVSERVVTEEILKENPHLNDPLREGAEVKVGDVIFVEVAAPAEDKKEEDTKEEEDTAADTQPEKVEEEEVKEEEKKELPDLTGLAHETTTIVSASMRGDRLVIRGADNCEYVLHGVLIKEFFEKNNLVWN